MTRWQDDKMIARRCQSRTLRVLLICILSSCHLVILSSFASAATRPAKPTAVTDWATCASADCHASVKKYAVVHGPIGKDACDACHKYDDPAKHTFTVTRQKAEMCTFCHEFKTDPMPVVHKPVRNGECLGCHNPHGGPTRAMMREATMAQTCGRCHDTEAMTKRFMHTPVKDGRCESCHQPHASKLPKLVDAAGADLCLYCHKDFKSQMAKVKFVHKAQQAGCGDCHDAHGTDFPKVVKKPIADLCLGCHEKMKQTTATATHKHPAVMGDRACLTCHTTHGSDLASLMAGPTAKVCMTCHDQAIKVDKTRIVPAVKEVLDPKTVKHGPIRDGQCGGCHTIHGGDSPLLLKKTNTSKLYNTFAVEKYGMCFDCHDPRLVQDGQTMTSFRNGQKNLHTVHVKDGDRGRNCSVCHATHASTQEQIVRETVLLGKWPMPVTFRKTGTGGSCSTGCHAVYSYDRVNPVAATRPAGTPATVVTTRPSVDHEQPVVAKFSAKDIAGAAVTVPDEKRPTIALFLRVEQAPSEQVRKLVSAAIGDGNAVRDVKVIVVLSGDLVAEQAKELAKEGQIDWPIVPDPEHEISRQLGVTAWPATVLVRPDGTVQFHAAGAPPSLTADLEAHLEFLAGQIDKDALAKQLATHEVVSDGATQKATWHLRMAEKLLAEGKADAAKAMITDGLKFDPASPLLQAALADALLHLNQARQAGDVLRKIPAGAIPEWQGKLLEARLAMLEERWDTARRLLVEVVKLNGESADAYYLLGQTYEHDKDWENAAKAYKAAQQR